jgi:hypothetical protein
MIPQERGLEGLSAYLFYITHFVYGGGGGNQLCELLGEGQEVLDPHELQKPIPGLWKGFSCWKILSFVLVIHSLSFPSPF